MLNKKSLYIYPLILPDLLIDHPLATIYTNSEIAFKEDEESKKEYNAAVNHQVYLWQEDMMDNVIH